MQLALDMARPALGQTGINPAVGCVIVKDGRIIGMGAHLRQGEAHAEVHALNMAGANAEGAVVYVTLEPCSHHGRTPPCAMRLVEAKVSKVVIAALDPNPLVAGKGAERLRESGIKVISGVLAQASLKMNEIFNHYITTGMPFVTMKTASTLDGKIATVSGDSRWISGSKAREEVHMLRHQHEAIMVGAATVMADDPSLTTRTEVQGIHPIRIVADSMLCIPEEARLLHDKAAPVIILTSAMADKSKKERLEQLGAKVITCGEGSRTDLRQAMQQLGEMKIGSILLEGGGKLNGSMLKEGLINKVILYYGTKLVGDPAAPANFQFKGINRMADAISLANVTAEMVGDDIRVTGYPVYAEEGRKY